MRSLWCGFVSVRFEHRNPFKPGRNVFVSLTFSLCIELARAVFVPSRFRMRQGLGGVHACWSMAGWFAETESRISHNSDPNRPQI